MIESIKHIFLSEKVYKIYSRCMYMPTYEKFVATAKAYMQDNTINMYGFYRQGVLAGVIVVKKQENNNVEIMGIAVAQAFQNNHIGKQLIAYVINTNNSVELFAQTDDDAVLFYKKCGFKIESFYKTYGKTKCKRYQCRYFLK